MVDDNYELNEVIRQFPFTEQEAFRDSAKSSVFNVQKIYEQIQHNDELYPSPVVLGNFIWKNGKQDSEVIFAPDPNGRWHIGWLPPIGMRNTNGPQNKLLGCAGVDSYDIDATVDGRGSKVHVIFIINSLLSIQQICLLLSMQVGHPWLKSFMKTY